MATYLKRCCVPGCSDTTASRHRFKVQNKAVLSIWLERIGNDEIKQYSATQLYNRCFVCSAHFIQECISRRGLMWNALPTRNVPGFSGEQTIANSFWHSSGEGTQGDLSSTAYTMAVSATGTEHMQLYPSTSGTDMPHAAVSTGSVEQWKHTRRINLLRMVDVKRQAQLSPKERKLYRVAAEFVQKSYNLSKRLVSVRSRLQAAKTMFASMVYNKLQSSVSNTVYNFILSQIRGCKLKPRDRRFTTEDKIVALSLYKCSPRGYRLLEKIFALPSRRTLSALLIQIPFRAGINEKMFSHLKTVVENLPQKDRYCNIIFDEMSLQASLQYDKYTDVIDGFECNGHTCNLKIADHALVFMAQGVYKAWKQPLSLTFSASAMKTADLAALIKAIIRKIISIGLIPVATICDQAAQNQAVIKLLLAETRQAYQQKNVECRLFGFEVDGVEIIPMYDYPHLLKCMRNQFLTKDILFKKDGMEKCASWQHIVSLYEMDVGRVGLRVCPKLSDFHIYPQKINKMKVKLCTQALSRSVGTLIGFLAENRVHPLQDAMGTADMIIFLDELFDSMNGVSPTSTSNNDLRCRVTSASAHINFWADAKRLLNTIRFRSPTTHQLCRPPTIRNWIHTISAFEYLWRQLQRKGFTYVIPKHFNQDAVENFFGMIRSHGIRNVNPTCSSFISSFKALIINNFMSARSVGRNCEDNLSCAALHNLETFIGTQEEEGSTTPQPTMEHASGTTAESPDNALATYAVAYVCGYLAKKILSVCSKCTTCVANFISPTVLPQHQFIQLKQNTRQQLLLLHSNFMVLFDQCVAIINTHLPKLCLQHQIAQKLQALIHNNINFNPILCPHHPTIPDVFVKVLVKFVIYTWVNDINKILRGSVSRFNPTTSPDNVKVMAYNWWLKHKK